MQIERRRSSPVARRAVKLGANIVLFALQWHGALLGSAYAASFQCGPHASASERAVCNDPQLSALDDKLAQVYRQALEMAPDKPAIAADRMTQWQWRQSHCTETACVRDWYERRIGELQADIAVNQKVQQETFEQSLAAQHLPPATHTVLQNLQYMSGL